jgi:hypothetical protein
MPAYKLRNPIEAARYTATWREQFAAKLAAMNPKARMRLPGPRWSYFCLSLPGVCNLFVHDGQWVTWDGRTFAACDNSEFDRLYVQT